MNKFSGISSLLGFHDEYLARMDVPAQRDWLVRANLSVFLGLFLMAVSTSVLMYMLSPGSGIFFSLAIGIWAISLAMLIKTHVLFITLGAAPLHREMPDRDIRIRASFRLAFFSFFALVLTQPLLLELQSYRLEAAAMERMKFKAKQLEALDRNQLAQRKNELLVKRSILVDEQQRVQASLTPLAPRVTPGQHGITRKAMLVGASKYAGDVQSLPNVANDITAMERKLRDMGYIVTVSKDDPKKELVRKLEVYAASLKSGDISLIYFSGHGMENAGHNYFLPSDFAAGVAGGAITKMNQDPAYARKRLSNFAVSITPYIAELTKEHLRLHLLVLDACRVDIEGKPRGLASMQSPTSRNVIIAMAASPGQVALDSLTGQIGGNSPYTAALLRNLERNEDVTKVFRRVAREVVDVTTFSNSVEGKPPQTPWLSLSATDDDIKLLAPSLERSPSALPRQKTTALAPSCGTDHERSGNLAAFGTCIDKEIGALNRQIEFLEDRLGVGPGSGQGEQQIDELLERAIFFAERLRALWTNYIPAFIGTLALTGLMLAGLVWRDWVNWAALRAYEQIRYHNQRDILRQEYSIQQAEIDKLVTPLRGSERLPRFKHWSTDQGFFTQAESYQERVIAPETDKNDQAATKMWDWLRELPNEETRA